MNRLIDTLFEKKIVVQILSVLMALLLWFIVLDAENPMETKTVSVPLTSNVDVLEDNNLRIVGTSLPTYVEVTVKGRRNKIKNVSYKDFSLSVDLGGVTASGMQEIKLPEPVYGGSSNVLVSAINPSSVSLRLERITGVEFPIEVIWTKDLPEGYEVVNFSIEPDSVILEDKESVVSKAARVSVSLNPNDAITSNTKWASVYTEEGKSISQFDGKISINVKYDIARSVPVMTTVKGDAAEEWYMKEYLLTPPTVRVLGKMTDLTQLAGINAASIDLTGKSGLVTQMLDLIVPSNVTLYKSEKTVQADVTLEKLETGTLSIPLSQVVLTGADDASGVQWTLRDQDFRVSIQAKPADLAAFRLDMAAFTVDVSGLAEGEHVLPVLITLPTTCKLIGTYELTVDGVAPATAETTLVQEAVQEP